jgi:hypothetical protein
MAGKTKYLSIQEINGRRDKSDELARVLICFLMAAQKRRGLHQDIPTLETPLLVHLRELAVQNLEERARMRQSSAG